MPYEVIIFRANGTIERKTQDKAPVLEALQDAVGGYIETVPYFTHYGELRKGRAYADEEGLLKGKGHNANASRAWQDCYQFAQGLVGDVVFYAKVKAEA